MGHIFVSYSRKDSETVDHIVQRINEAGFNVWIDREEIKAGQLWRTQIVEAIDTCDAFVLILSSNSAVSENVRKEIDLAQDARRSVFIIRLNEVKPPADIRYQLAGLQHIDLEILGFDEAVKQLIETLKEQSKSAREQSVRQVELVIEGVDLVTFGPEKREQLLDFVSELANTPSSQLQIAEVVTGSLHVFVDMPARAAFELKTRALNRDHHFKQLGIQSLRLAGDRKYINIALGILTTTATLGFLKLLWMSIPSLFSSIVGITGGKVLVITSAVVITTVVSLAVYEKGSNISIPTQTATSTPSPTATSTPTAIPQLPVLQDTQCWNGPGSTYLVISSLKAGTRVELLGRGNIAGWLIVLNPRYQVPCWMRISDLQIDPDFDISYLPTFTPPAMPPSEKGNSPDITVTPTRWSLPPCVYAGTCIFPIPTTPAPPPN